MTVSHVVAGIDTHKDTHVAAVLDMASGLLLATNSFANDPAGLQLLHVWVSGHGTIDWVGIEGTGSYGCGLTTVLRSKQVTVWEVNRPNRQRRRRAGKSDTADAHAAARGVLAMDMVAVPKTHDGPVEAIRVPARYASNSSTHH